MPGFVALLLSVVAHAITGGTPVEEGQFPSYAALVYDNGSSICSGTLIAPDVVLTAAYCVGERVNSVRLGPTRNDVPDGEELQVREAILHPDVDGPALLLLVRGSTLEPTEIALGCALDDLVDGARVHEVGYGATDANGDDWPDEVRWARSKVRDHDCSDPAVCPQGTAPMLATDGNGAGACSGDGGGPVYLPTDHGTYLAGISFASSNDSPTFCSGLNVHLRADAHRDWIEESAGITLTEPTCAGPATEPEPKEEGCGCVVVGGPWTGWPFALIVLLGALRTRTSARGGRW